MAALAVGIPAASAADGSSVTEQIARALADGESRSAARMICDYGYADEMEDLGHVLSAADFLVVDAGGTDAQVEVFADAVNDAYRFAAVPRDVAGMSFVIGLGDIIQGYAGEPSDPVAFWSTQANIGTGILARVGQEWVVSPIPAAPCSVPF
jgi:hypothetical protein